MMALIEKGRSCVTDSAQSVMIPRERKRHCVTTNSFNGNLISAFDYTNDEVGRRTARLDALSNMVATTNAFGYNTRSEVTSANMGTNTDGYVFDPIGNRTTAANNADVTSYAANGLNQYTAISNTVSVQPVHDDDGNMLTNGVWSYTWDGENRLKGVSSNDVLFATYTYDHRSRRIGKVAGETTHSFLCDGWNLIQETFGTNATHYVWGLDFSGSLQGAGGVGGLLTVLSPLPLGEGQGEGSTVYLPCYDANGNICEYSSIDGSIVAHYEYSPFGETVIQSGELADAFSFRFSTKYWEKEIGLYYYGYRFYAPGVGRWLNRDPIGERGGSNLYAFVHNCTHNKVDFRGLWGVDWDMSDKQLDEYLKSNPDGTGCCNYARQLYKKYKTAKKAKTAGLFVDLPLGWNNFADTKDASSVGFELFAIFGDLELWGRVSFNWTFDFLSSTINGAGIRTPTYLMEQAIEMGVDELFGSALSDTLRMATGNTQCERSLQRLGMATQLAVLSGVMKERWETWDQQVEGSYDGLLESRKTKCPHLYAQEKKRLKKWMNHWEENANSMKDLVKEHKKDVESSCGISLSGGDDGIPHLN